VRSLSHRYGNGFTFQWHLTTACGYRCEHCYVRDRRSEPSERAGLAEKELISIVDRLDEFYNDLGEYRGSVRPPKYVALTGGDPLLHPAFRRIVDRLSSRGYGLGILGCPETFTEDMAAFLRNTALRSVQFSLDGLARTHDRLRRSPGSFERTVETALRLQDDFDVNIMFTVCRENMHELIPLLHVLDERGVRRFDFARVTLTGAATDQALIPAREYRALLEAVDAFDTSRPAGVNGLRIGKKDNLWKLLKYEQGTPLSELGLCGEKSEVTEGESRRVRSGCPCGYTSLAVLADGALWICRRFVSQIGQLPRDRIFPLFAHHPDVKAFRTLRRYEGCAECELGPVCRGCPAVPASVYGAPHRPDPQCWRCAEDGTVR
jgi:radical SAM protein with 4Fe4S-binding SPASM domain